MVLFHTSATLSDDRIISTRRSECFLHLRKDLRVARIKVSEDRIYMHCLPDPPHNPGRIAPRDREPMSDFVIVWLAPAIHHSKKIS